jgi:hypothetical protein
MPVNDAPGLLLTISPSVHGSNRLLDGSTARAQNPADNADSEYQQPGWNTDQRDPHERAEVREVREHAEVALRTNAGRKGYAEKANRDYEKAGALDPRPPSVVLVSFCHLPFSVEPRPPRRPRCVGP